MKANEIKIGESYEAKVGPRWVEVEIVRALGKGGFEARGASGKPVKVKDAAHLRPVPAPKVAPTKVAKAKPTQLSPTPAKTVTEAVTPAPATESPAPSQPGEPVGNAPADHDVMPITKVMKEPAAPARAKKPRPMGKSTGLDGAVKVLQANGEPLSCLDLMNRMLAAGFWRTSGKTPAATLNSALHREIKVKGAASRFIKAGRGLFALNTNVATTEGR